MRRLGTLAILAVTVGGTLLAGQVAVPPAAQQLAHDVLKELIEINTTDSSGNVTQAAEAMAAGSAAPASPRVTSRCSARFRRRATWWRGSAGPARASPSSCSPTSTSSKRAARTGRSIPSRSSSATATSTAAARPTSSRARRCSSPNLIRLKQEGFKPDRDLIVALTADEEGGTANGVSWLLQSHRDLIDAEYCLNTDGGGGEIRKGKRIANELQTSEKVYLSFRLETKNQGGHSSLPVKDNAIYRLADGLVAPRRVRLPDRLNETTRTFFERMSCVEQGDLARDMKAVSENALDPAAAERLAASSPYFNALLRTTCVATGLEGGHAENALPQTARAVVNCRILPEESPALVQQTLGEGAG